MCEQIVAQYDGVVVLSVARAVEQGHVVPYCGVDKWLPCPRVVVEFPDVTPSELRPLRWVVGEPLSQVAAGGDVLAPAVEMNGVASNPTWP
jgi:hypothetical protein